MRAFCLALVVACALAGQPEPLAAGEEPNASQLDAAKMYIKEIATDSAPLKAMQGLEKHEEKEMKAIKLELTEGLSTFSAGNGKSDGKAQDHHAQLGEDKKPPIPLQTPQNEVAQAATFVAKELEKSAKDESAQQDAAELAMKRIDATLQKLRLNEEASPKPNTNKDEETSPKLDKHTKPTADPSLGESVKAQWAPLENAANQLSSVYQTLAVSTQGHATANLLKKMQAEDAQLLKQAGGVKVAMKKASTPVIPAPLQPKKPTTQTKPAAKYKEDKAENGPEKTAAAHKPEAHKPATEKTAAHKPETHKPATEKTAAAHKPEAAHKPAAHKPGPITTAANDNNVGGPGDHPGVEELGEEKEDKAENGPGPITTAANDNYEGGHKIHPSTAAKDTAGDTNGALTQLKKSVAAAEGPEKSEKPAISKKALVRKEAREVKTLLRQEKTVMNAEKADEVEVGTLVSKLN